MNLNDADLVEADLSRTLLIRTKLNGANLIRTKLNGAILMASDLSKADLSGADLSGADLNGAELIGTNFSAADLRGAILARTNLSEAILFDANLSGANFGFTTIGSVDISDAKGLETAVHVGPSTIGIDTIYKSQGKISEAFLRGAGVPDNFITYMASIVGQAFDFYSCFISHSSKDDPFAQRLYADLQAQGVRCWFAPEDLKIGEPILTGIDSAIRLHDKLLLILSDTSVQSRWVQHEVMSATSKEYQQGGESRVLFPVRIDDAVIDTDVQWARTLRDTRHIGDFTNWKDHDSYQTAFSRLIRDLQQSETGKPK